jgi:hypothetical protein
VDDDLVEDLAALEALESLPSRPLTPTERTHKHRRKWGPGGKEAFEEGDRSGGQEAYVDLINRLPTPVIDRMIACRATPFEVIAVWTEFLDELDLWFEATGERFKTDQALAEV